MKKFHNPFIFLVIAVCLGISCKSNPAAASSDKAITSFSFINPAKTGQIDESAKTISVTVPEGTSLKALVAEFTTTGVNVSVGGMLQVSGTTPNDFTNPVVYTVKAEDNSSVDYTVTVTVLIVPKAITSFSLMDPPVTGDIDDTSRTIVVNLSDTSTDVTALVAAFTTSGVHVSVDSVVQVSGTTPNDFTDPVIYTVSATDGSMANYTVYVIKPVSWIAYNWDSVVEPPTGWTDREDMGSYCTIDGGILSFNSGTGANQAHYRYAFSENFTVGSKMTLAFKARADGGSGTHAWMLDFQNGKRGQLELRNGRAALLNGSSNIGSATVSSSEWHTYFVTYEVISISEQSTGLQIKVYIDGKRSVGISGIADAQAGSIYIRLGDMSGNNPYIGSIDWIIWTFNGAYVPGVALPAGYSLTP